MSGTDVLASMRHLPDWLVAVTDPARVADALAAGNLYQGQYRVTRVMPSQVRLKDDGWRIWYEVTIASDDDSSRTLRLVATLLSPYAEDPEEPVSVGYVGSREWRCWLPDLRLALESEPPDGDLSALPLLTDPERSRGLLEAGIAEQSPAYREFRIRSCEPRVVRYSPASRCTVAYRLGFHEADRSRRWPEVVVAKTYHGDKGRAAWDGMRAGWDTPLSRGDPVGVAEPLAFLPDIRVLIQGGVPEDKTLKGVISEACTADDVTGPQLERVVRLAADGLAALHGCGAVAGATLTWDDEVAEARQVLTRLGRAVPPLLGVLDPLLEDLEARASASAPDPVVPSHGTFRPAQVLLGGGRASMIDFDGFCLAEPALDVALFRSSVRDIALSELTDGSGAAPDDDALRRRADEAEAVCDSFLSQYCSHRAVSCSRVMLFETLDLLTLVLHGWTKLRPTRLRHGVLLLEDHLRRLPETA